MAGLGDIVQKAFYLGLGIASYAGEKAGSTLSELRSQAQKLADEMVSRGEITAEEAKRMVDDMVTRAQQSPSSPTPGPAEPIRIEILDDEEPPTSTDADKLREQVEKLREELNNLRQSS
ncbi:MAG: phasin family protein [Synechococcales cyanobacterium T60_A2020_003]|nr:phasin family protein [Synechococcales cyanobacterium T60_A2020_003]